ncbi:hypothetical protein PITC_010590 [Penicillium italicum]|uniref:Uncharacterized protein n=1 Tax=Penicillium italicum TaxID=40296 RepID=A0A0A2LCG7_PENIT|nr:hypothetical protein PITC_010590 [Penicillium italicum]
MKRSGAMVGPKPTKACGESEMALASVVEKS